MSATRAETEPGVEGIAAARYDRPHLTRALVAAACIHALAVIALPAINARKRSPQGHSPLVDVAVDPAPPPAVAQPGLEAGRVARAKRATLPPAGRASASPPEPAVAVLLDPSEPIDMSDRFVVGSAAPQAGVFANDAGASVGAASDSRAPRGGGGDATPAPAVAAAGPDRSRHPSLMGGSDWKCPFPSEADAARIDFAVVTLRVDIDATGHPSRVVTVEDPGHGFGREARRCALARSWAHALDREGRATASSVAIRVRFER